MELANWPARQCLHSNYELRLHVYFNEWSSRYSLNQLIANQQFPIKQTYLCSFVSYCLSISVNNSVHSCQTKQRAKISFLIVKLLLFCIRKTNKNGRKWLLYLLLLFTNWFNNWNLHLSCKDFIIGWKSQIIICWFERVLKVRGFR